MLTDHALVGRFKAINGSTQTIGVVLVAPNEDGTLRTMFRKGAHVGRWSTFNTDTDVDELNKAVAVATLDTQIIKTMTFAPGQILEFEGFHVLDLTEEEKSSLGVGPRSVPSSFSARVGELMDTWTVTDPKPVTKKFVFASDASEWFYEGVLRRMKSASSIDELKDITMSGAQATTGPEIVRDTSAEDEDGAIILKDGTKFYNYDMTSGIDCISFLRTARENNMFVLLRGEPGTGKSRYAQAAFVDEHMEMIMCDADTNRTDLVGTYVPTDVPGKWRWVDGPLLRAMEWKNEEGEKVGCVLFVDEVMLADPRNLSALYAAIDGRREVYVTDNQERGTVTAGPKFYVVFASNPNVPGAMMSEALASRAVLKPRHTTNYDVAEKMLGKKYARIIQVARIMEEKRRNRETGWAPQMRDLIAYADAAEAFGWQTAMSNLLESTSSESDRQVLIDVIMREMEVGTIPVFMI